MITGNFKQHDVAHERTGAQIRIGRKDALEQIACHYFALHEEISLARMNELCGAYAGVHTLGNNFDCEIIGILAERNEKSLQLVKLVRFNNEYGVHKIACVNNGFKCVCIVCANECNC